MSMKAGLLFLIASIFCIYLNNQCQAIQCYSCSDCNNATRLTWNIIQTVDKADQCIKVSIFAQNYNQGRVILNRGASSKCKPYAADKGKSIYCCSTDLCNN